MSILPEGEDLRRAVKHMSERHAESPNVPATELVREAAEHFDLSPLDTEFLYRCVEKGSLKTGEPCAEDKGSS
ncbi:MAG: hypothetical protein KKA60_01985 [Proteobacteria bacterium]|nr:hypothetical protein [Pseudomonadota bacterium]